MDTLLHYWQLFTQGARDQIVGGLFIIGVTTVATTGAVIFRKSIGAAVRRLLLRGQTPEQVRPAPQELIIKVEQSPPPPLLVASPPTPAPAPTHARVAAIPNFLVVDFVARRDTEGRDIVTCLREELQPHRQQLVVLWGAGGVGKTTLAAETARALLDTYAGRLVWTSALGRNDYALSTLLDEIATQLERADLRPLALAPKREAVTASVFGASASGRRSARLSCAAISSSRVESA